ncbi:hypothetical protein EMIHUDRAFT_119089 [Emiliania huxleyi CCMP1516]|uniref:J domain-containing protein n=2 Tax=Emiliania huxleyi TaxID=2903 RepID=A0A0D3IY53_EMIH1|nr:hypothetical protein EMIHUDRAFT_119089 [Emiliania huxleyi CCMP1516]EOD16188.1 hypothetical protein EMIHUDRAFT_119089 [Emiliania huxleyi CCMP1516]|eukprot:XP_005768617.1 hypothetical protein EMIHUDRAFT_119089 [Emiliania huxleyi CCMP1516]
MLTCLAARRLLGTAAPSPWAVLGVRRGEELDECKRAFRRLALSLHPDVAGDDPGAAERFAAVVRAFEEIRDGTGPGTAPRGRWLRGVRSVDDVLTVSVSDLRTDPAYEVHNLLVALDDPAAPPAPSGAASAAASEAAAVVAADAAGGSAVGVEIVHLLRCFPDHSIADLHGLAEELVGVDAATAGRRRVGGNELVWRGQLLAEHLFVQDYAIASTDMIHYVVCRQ